VNINNSALQTYLKCGTKYEFEYIKKVNRPQTWPLFRGSTLHTVRKKNLQQKIESRKDLPLEELRENALEIVRESVATESFVPEPDVKEPENIIDAGLTQDFEVFQKPTIPVCVEKQTQIAPVGYDYILFGTRDLYDNKKFLRDLKTTTRMPNISDLLRSTQMTTYQLFTMAEGEKVDKIQHDYLIFMKKGVEALPLVVEPRTKEDIRSVLDTFQVAVMGIQAGIFLPAPAGSWWCHPKWCCYWPICPHITKAAKQYFISKGEE
jgi:CRISPR/Cas system-associated exonuclease Cas4 (RecB family)